MKAYDTPHPLSAAIWSALMNRCAAHKPDEHHRVRRLVMVSRDDVEASIRAGIMAPATLHEMAAAFIEAMRSGPEPIDLPADRVIQALDAALTSKGVAAATPAALPEEVDAVERFIRVSLAMIERPDNGYTEVSEEFSHDEDAAIRAEINARKPGLMEPAGEGRRRIEQMYATDSLQIRHWHSLRNLLSRLFPNRPGRLAQSHAQAS